ncbi:DNA-directed RNA polymerase subunit omega [Rhizobiales bacterium GAS113]|nr:DNA-directed RNA polymerase subunit omega [Rhizobiales bacterium GAS113]
MNPLLPVDCNRFVPDRFALVHVAAARARALNRGTKPRLPAAAAPPCELALREIAAGTLTVEEIDQLLLEPLSPDDDDPAPARPTDQNELRDRGSERPSASR